MKNSNSNNNISSILNVLGITPQIMIFFLLTILFVGIIIGLFVKKQNVVNRRMTVVDSVISDDEKRILEQSVKLGNDINQIKNSPFEKNSLIMEKTDKPVIAVIIDDMGIDMIKTQEVLGLGYPLTVSYLTYAPNLQSQINHAKELNHEILLHVPMQALNDNYDYGGEYLSTNNSKNRNLEILKSQLDKVEGYIGINNHMGSKFTSDESQLSMVIRELSNRGLSFVDSLTTSQSKGDIVAKDVKIPYATRDVFLDDSNKLEDIKKSLKYLETIAKKRGFSVAIGHPRTNTIKVLKAWLPRLQKKGIELVPISYIIKNYPKF